MSYPINSKEKLVRDETEAVLSLVYSGLFISGLSFCLLLCVFATRRWQFVLSKALVLSHLNKVRYSFDEKSTFVNPSEL